MHAVTTRSRRSAAALAIGSALLMVSGCGLVNIGGSDDAQPRAAAEQANLPEQTASKAPAPPAVLTVSPDDQAASVLPNEPVTVAVADGELDTVTVEDEKGAAIKGKVEGTTWTASQLLRPSATYTMTASATNADGEVTTNTSTFRTLKPKVTATYGVLYAGQTVGIGAPATIQFDSAVTTPAMRAAVERRVKVTTDPVTQGSWGWLDDRQLMWRPSEYWKPGTKVKVSAPLSGVQTGPDKWVGNDDGASFTIGDAMVSTVNIATHQMTVTKNGKVLRTIPVSSGRPGATTETRSGTKVIIAKEGTVTMDSATIGIPKGAPGYYRTIADNSLRVTWTGEYLHSAPWSVGSQGVANVSHGCVNLSPANAAWMYDQSTVGDIVDFTGSNRTFLPSEGIGVWQFSYANWKSQSALS